MSLVVRESACGFALTCVYLWCQVSWTQALRTIVKNCYKQHGREDLLYAFEDQQVTPQQVAAAATHSIAHLVPSQTVVQTISNPDGTVSLIQVSSAFRSPGLVWKRQHRQRGKRTSPHQQLPPGLVPPCD